MLNEFYSAFRSYALYTYQRNTDNEVSIYSGFHRNGVSFIINRLNGTTWKYINLITLIINQEMHLYKISH